MTWLREQGGFGPESSVGLSVPQASGVIPALLMTLYRKVEGVPATELLAAPWGCELVARIIDAANKLHRADLPLPRSHTIADELRILHDRLAIVAMRNPRWSGRIERILHGCERLAETLT